MAPSVFSASRYIHSSHAVLYLGFKSPDIFTLPIKFYQIFFLVYFQIEIEVIDAPYWHRAQFLVHDHVQVKVIINQNFLQSVNCLFTFFLTTFNQQKDHMNPVWPLSPQKDASYYLLHMTPHGKSRAVYIALLQQPPDCLMLVFFSVMNTLSKG